MKSKSLVAMLLIAAVLTGGFAAAQELGKARFKADAGLSMQPAVLNQVKARLNTDAELSISPETLEQVKAKVPSTYADAEASINVTQGKFLLWTRDGTHIMWGRYGSNYFAGQDNLGKKAWGIYWNNNFAGFYGQEFFYGKYRNGHWKAVNLFGAKRSAGSYVLFPANLPIAMAANAATMEQ